MTTKPEAVPLLSAKDANRVANNWPYPEQEKVCRALRAIASGAAIVIPAAERVDVERVRAAAKKFDDILSATGGCSDGNCVVKRPTGMHTNGGCRCYDNRLKAQRVMRAAKLLRDELEAALPAKQEGRG